MTIDDITVRIKLIDPPRSTLLAQAEVIFNDLIETKGWRIMPSQKIHPKFQELLWIQPPVHKVGFQYHPTVFIADKLLYEQVEEKIYYKYRSVKSNTPPSNPSTATSGEDKEQEVNINDINF